MRWISFLFIVTSYVGMCFAQTEPALQPAPPRPAVTDILTPPPNAVLKAEFVDEFPAIQFDIMILQVGSDDVRYIGEEAQIKQDVEQLAQEVRSLRVTKTQVSPSPQSHPRSTSEMQSSLRALAMDVTELVNRKRGMTLLSRPSMITRAGEAAIVTVGQQAELPYMERVDADTFKLRRTEKKHLGIDLSITPSEPKQAAGDKGIQKRVSRASVKLSISAIDGRFPIEGVDLPIGVPTISTRSIETTIELQEGEPAIIELPVAAGKHVYMFVTMLLPK